MTIYLTIVATLLYVLMGMGVTKLFLLDKDTPASEISTPMVVALWPLVLLWWGVKL